MKHALAKIIIALSAVLFSAAAAAAQEPEVVAQLERTRVYEGESVGYQVLLNNVENPTAPDLSAFTDFEVVPAGEQSLNSSNITVINGRVSKVERRGRAYNYRLTPLRSGTLTVPAPKAKVDGRVISGREFTLTVVPPENQGIVRMEISSEPQGVYPMQPFTVSLSIFVKPLPGEMAAEEPLGVASKAPNLTIPWVNDEDLPAGIKPQVDWKTWLGEYRSGGRAGFVVNNLVGRSSILTMFEDRNELLFRPRPTRVLQNDENGKPAEYWKYSFVRTFIAKSPGSYTFGPAALKGLFADGVSDAGRLQGRDIYTMARPLTLAVKDVPEEGRPDSYVGLVGTFKAKAALAPQKAKVGDPLTLTLAIDGQGSVENAAAPNLAALPGVAERFKVYDATEQSSDDSITFTYSLRPLVEGNEPFPAIPLSYFDVAAGRYETIETPPITLEVAKAEQLSARQIVAARGPGSGGNTQIEASREGIFANITDSNAVRDDSARPERWLVFLGALAVVYIVLALASRRCKRLQGDPALLRRRGAAAAAQARLRAGQKALAAGDVRAGSQSLKDALTGLVADVADLAQAGLTPKDVAAQLQKFNLPPEIIARTQSLLETCDAARYAAAGIEAAAIGREADGLFALLTKELKRRGLFR